jgi:iron complex transport system ATP-binding protein
VVLIKQGAVRADGPPAEVYRPEILSDVYGTRLQVVTDAATGIPFALPAGP